jgi:hypothetical protein
MKKFNQKYINRIILSKLFENYNLPGSDTSAGPATPGYEGDSYYDRNFLPTDTQSSSNNKVRPFDKYSDYDIDKKFEVPRDWGRYLEREFPWDSNHPLWQDPDFVRIMRTLYELRRNWGNMEWFRANYGEPNQNNNFFQQMMRFMHEIRFVWTTWDPTSQKQVLYQYPNFNNPGWDQIFK